MKKLSYKTTKIKLSDEEKRERVLFYNEYNKGFEPPVDVESFVKREIYDEYVDFICDRCRFEQTIDYDLVLEFGENEEGLPELYCTKCNKGIMRPKYIIKN